MPLKSNHSSSCSSIEVEGDEQCQTTHRLTLFVLPSLTKTMSFWSKQHQNKLFHLNERV
jgi:hypothetical protein